LVNNSNTTECSLSYRPGTWHEAIITYDDGTANLFLDGKLGCSLPVDLIHRDDRQITLANFANGTVFEGTFRNLKVYNEAIQPAGGPIAAYPLQESGNDITGNYNPMTLGNTPFQAGGIYCNGVYVTDSNTTTGCYAVTPRLEEMNLSTLSIVAEFNAARFRTMPVFVAGRGSRWVGYTLTADGGVRLLVNNSDYTDCSLRYRPGTWHQAIVTYDGRTANLFLDGELGCSLPVDLIHRDDRQITLANFANGTVFEGIFRNLQVYNRIIEP
jgi:hypothetical protein